MSERNQRFFVIVVHFQYFYAPVVQDLGHHPNELAAVVNGASLQLKGIERTTHRRNQLVLSYSNFSADNSFSICDRIRSTKLQDTASMLPSEKLHFRIVRARFSQNYHLAPGRKVPS